MSSGSAMTPVSYRPSEVFTGLQRFTVCLEAVMFFDKSAKV